MKTEIQDTSEEAFKEIRNNSQEKACILIYNTLKKAGSCPNSVIRKITGLPINIITGRINDLRNKDKYKVVGFDKKDYCPIQLAKDGTKRLVCFWKVVKDWDTLKDRESSIFDDVSRNCYKCGCLNCECKENNG